MTHNSLLAVATTAGLHRIAARFKTLARFVKLPRCLGQTTHTKKPALGRFKMWRAWHDSKRMAALGSPPAPTAWFVDRVANLTYRF